MSTAPLQRWRRRSRSSASLLAALALALTACPSATTDSAASTTPAATADSSSAGAAPTPAAATPACTASLAGTYHHEDDPTYRYDVTDNGTDVVITAYRQTEAGRAPLSEEGEGAGVITLHRTAAGLVGSAQGTATTHGGAACDVEFPYQVVGCDQDGVTLATQHEFTLNEDCTVEEESLPPSLVENRLVRDNGPAPASPADAGA